MKLTQPIDLQDLSHNSFNPASHHSTPYQDQSVQYGLYREKSDQGSQTQLTLKSLRHQTSFSVDTQTMPCTNLPNNRYDQATEVEGKFDESLFMPFAPVHKQLNSYDRRSGTEIKRHNYSRYDAPQIDESLQEDLLSSQEVSPSQPFRNLSQARQVISKKRRRVKALTQY